MADRKFTGVLAADGQTRLPTLLEACDEPKLFGIDLTDRQRELLSEVEAGNVLHVWTLGRRSGKTLLAALLALHWCLFRPDCAQYVRKRERRYAVAVATSLRQARIFVDMARSITDASPVLHDWVEATDQDSIRFKGGTTLAAFPCTSRGGRGWPIGLLLLDEFAHQLDTDGNQAAEPVYRSLSPAVAQFGADARVIVASTPYGVDGFFADLFHTVEKGELEGAVSAQASTMEMRPALSTVALELERQRDPDGFRSEYLAQFVAAGGSFLDGAMVTAAVTREGELAPGEVDAPVGGLDLGLNSDSTGLTILGRDRDNRRRLRLVLARGWKPDMVGGLGFGPTLDEVADICLAHGVHRIYVDQYCATAVVEHLARRGVHATVVPTTAQTKSQMFGDLKQRLYKGELELYDEPELLAELRRIETVTTPGAATVRIRRLGSSHGDRATALALAAWKLRGVGRTSLPSVTNARIPGVDAAGFGRGGRRRDAAVEALAGVGIHSFQPGIGGRATTSEPVPTPAAGTGSLIVAHDAQAELAGYLGEGDA